MNPISRRSFLAASATAMGALALRSSIRAAESPPAAAAGRGFRIFACDWTLKYTSAPEAFEVAARLGLDGVQTDFGSVPADATRPPLFDEAHQDRILEASVRHKVPIASLAMGVLNNIPYKSEAAPEQWVLDSVKVMQRMKVPVTLLAFFGKGDLVGDAAGIEEVIRRLKKVVPHAEAAGVVFGFESMLKAPELEHILDAVNSPALKVYYDVGNMQSVGEFFGEAIRRLGRERICEIHLKDYHDLYGKGSMNFPGLRLTLDDIGYRGWLGIEGIKTPLGTEPSIRYDLAYLRNVFPTTA